MLAQAAARAGFIVNAIDGFGDVDTREIAERILTVPVSVGFDATNLPPVVDAMLRHRRPDCVVYGSGFEAAPDLLEQSFGAIEIAGNSAAVIRAVKDPLSLSDALYAERITCPLVQVGGGVTGSGWLIKRIGASGGGHIRVGKPGEFIPDGSYAQRQVDGQSMSALFISDALNCQLLGTSEHWCAQPNLLSPFQHSGLVGIVLPDPLREKIVDWGLRCARKFGLRGLWGMDFVVDAYGEPHLIEINPRPPASMELFDCSGTLFCAHIAACAGELSEVTVRDQCAASAVIYANRDGQVPEQFSWPDWTADRPASGARTERGQPLCTVRCQGSSPSLAMANAQDCCRVLQQSMAEAFNVDSNSTLTAIQSIGDGATSDKIV
jgi:predicted ATP-grasp superfamily ATP-dependent carboligase